MAPSHGEGKARQKAERCGVAPHDAPDAPDAHGPHPPPWSHFIGRATDIERSTHAFCQMAEGFSVHALCDGCARGPMAQARPVTARSNQIFFAIRNTVDTYRNRCAWFITAGCWYRTKLSTAEPANPLFFYSTCVPHRTEEALDVIPIQTRNRRRAAGRRAAAKEPHRRGKVGLLAALPGHLPRGGCTGLTPPLQLAPSCLCPSRCRAEA